MQVHQTTTALTAAMRMWSEAINYIELNIEDNSWGLSHLNGTDRVGAVVGQGGSIESMCSKQQTTVQNPHKCTHEWDRCPWHVWQV